MEKSDNAMRGYFWAAQQQKLRIVNTTTITILPVQEQHLLVQFVYINEAAFELVSLLRHF